MNAFEFHCPTRIICGEHALHKLPVILVEMGVTKPLVVTDANLVALGITDHAIHRLTEAGFPFAFCDQVPPDSSLSVVNDVAAIYEQEGCDGFIAFGGGSVIDTTKGAAASISVGNRDIAELQGAEILQNDLDPLIAIPTTAGTGSEVTLVAVIADEEAHEKLSYTSYKLVPHVAFLDPLLTASLPPKLTATTGVDALTHAIEAYTSIQKNPVSDALARRRSRSSPKTSCALAKNRETLMCAPRSRSAACSQAPASRTPWWASYMRSAIRSAASATSPMARP